MAELTQIENEILSAMKEIGAVNEEKKKTADDIAKKSNRPKGLVTNTLVSLANKGSIKRVAREKSAGYYIIGSN